MKPTPTDPACPECCFKHLMAAWAVLQTTADCDVDAADMSDVLLAGANIVAGEVLAGYNDNRPVLIGYLAAAEQLQPKRAPVLRRLRKIAADSDSDSLSLGVFDLPDPIQDASWLLANLVEAEREAPEDYEEAVGDLRRTAFEGNLLPMQVLTVATKLAKTYELLPATEELKI